jgi:hypothetical protein
MTTHPNTKPLFTDAQPVLPIRVKGKNLQDACSGAAALQAHLHGSQTEIVPVEDSPEVIRYVRTASAATV